MARLFTSGFEWGSTAAENQISGATEAATAGAARTGSFGYRSSTGTEFDFLLAQTLGVTYFFRFYFRKSGNPSSKTGIGGPIAEVAQVALNTDGTIQLECPKATVIGSPSSALSNNTWYRIELAWKVQSGSGDDTGTLRLDGVEVASTTTATAGTVASSDIFVGSDAGDVGVNLDFDDLAVNNDSGADQNSWPGEGKIVLCVPISDNQDGSWRGGAGGTGIDLSTAVNNIPPVGLVSGSATNTSQMESADSSGNNATDEYRGNMTTYTNAGIGASDTITLVHPIINHGEDIATNTKTGDVYMQSNPAGSAGTGTFTFGNDAGAINTWPTNWRVSFGAPIYSPSVTKGDSPVVAVRKTDATTRVGSVDALGVYVDYVPVAGSVEAPTIVALQAVNRSSIY